MAFSSIVALSLPVYEAILPVSSLIRKRDLKGTGHGHPVTMPVHQPYRGSPGQPCSPCLNICNLQRGRSLWKQEESAASSASQLFYLRHRIGNLNAQTAEIGLGHSCRFNCETACEPMDVYGDVGGGVLLFQTPSPPTGQQLHLEASANHSHAEGTGKADRQAEADRQTSRQAGGVDGLEARALEIFISVF